MITSNCYDTDFGFRIDYKISDKLVARIYGTYENSSIYECYIRNDLKQNQLNELLGRLYGDGYKDYKLVDAI